MVKNNIVMENARIGFRNFSGKEGKFNPAGKRNFCVFIERDLGEKLESDGWNVRWLQPKEEGDEPQAYLQVSVSYDNIPPKLVLITSHGKTVLDDETVDMLDWVEIKTVDLIIRPYNWSVNGKSGVKAYIKSMYVTIMEDVFEQKYLDVPDTAMKAIAAPSNGDPDSIDVDWENA
jgi:hypothetical protein